MKNEDLQKFKELYDVYSWSQTVCDPPSFSYRQNELIKSIAEFLLVDYLEYLDKLEGEK